MGIESDIIALEFDLPEAPRFVEIFSGGQAQGIWVNVEELEDVTKARVLDAWREVRHTLVDE